MNLLVTGGAGFIGSNLIRLIIDRPEVEKIVNLDALTYAGSLENLAGIHDLHPLYHFEHVDLRDAAAVKHVVQQHDITHVMHLAAESHVDRSIASAGVFMETNVLGTLNLLDACRGHWTDEPSYGQPRFIHVSTDEVYGSLGLGDAPFTEESPLQPNSPYAASKAAADCLVRSYIQTYGFPATITRCCNNYGPNQHSEKFIPTILRCLREGRPIPVYGDGQNIREWIYVEDHAEALWTVLNKGEIGEIYNIGSGDELSNMELITRIYRHSTTEKFHPRQRPYSLVSYITDRPGHDHRYAINASKLKKLGWSSLLVSDVFFVALKKSF